MKKMKIAVLDDYQNVAFDMADWTVLNDSSEITVFNDHEADEARLEEKLKPFDVICVMRERTPLRRVLLSKLPELKLIVSTGTINASIDLRAAEELGIEVKNTGYLMTGAPELTWALLMSIARHIPQENESFKSGGWQTTIGTDLKGKTIGLVGLGNIGQKIARIAIAFEMKVIAWSENLTAEKAAPHGVEAVSKETLFRESDFISIHLILSKRSRGIIALAELEMMKKSAYLINTSRGPLVNEDALIEVLTARKIAGAALDVYDTEPLAADHPFRKLDNVLGTSHIGYVTEDTYKIFYKDSVRIINDWTAANF